MSGSQKTVAERSVEQNVVEQEQSRERTKSAASATDPVNILLSHHWN